MIDIVVIDHSLVDQTHWTRWKFLAERHPVNVNLVVPKFWQHGKRGDTISDEATYETPHIDDDGFRIIPLRTTSTENWMRYLFVSHDMEFRSIEPDIVHTQHSELTPVNHQAILYRDLWASDAKFTFHTMNALGVPRENLHQRLRWWHLKKNSAAALAHYPGCLESLRDADFEKPVYLQTSYGVDETIFYPNEEKRENARRELELDGRFVIGFTGRLTPDKGVDDLIEAMPIEGVDWSLLLVGDGEMRGRIERTARREGWEDRVVMTGYVPREEVPRYVLAMDCFVLGSKTREYWIDTFPRSIVEAMACEVPVIGSDSGAIPFQIDDSGLVFPEGEAVELRERIRRLAQNPSLREELASQGREQSVSRFGQETLADNFYEILKQVHSGDIKYNDEGEHTQYKAY